MAVWDTISILVVCNMCARKWINGTLYLRTHPESFSMEEHQQPSSVALAKLQSPIYDPSCFVIFLACVCSNPSKIWLNVLFCGTMMHSYPGPHGSLQTQQLSAVAPDNSRRRGLFLAGLWWTRDAKLSLPFGFILESVCIHEDTQIHEWFQLLSCFKSLAFDNLNFQKWCRHSKRI